MIHYHYTVAVLYCTSICIIYYSGVCQFEICCSHDKSSRIASFFCLQCLSVTTASFFHLEIATKSSDDWQWVIRFLSLKKFFLSRLYCCSTYTLEHIIFNILLLYCLFEWLLICSVYFKQKLCVLFSLENIYVFFKFFCEVGGSSFENPKDFKEQMKRSLVLCTRPNYGRYYIL